MSIDRWERNEKEELIPIESMLVVKDKVLERAINVTTLRVNQITDPDKKKVYLRAIELLEESLKEKTISLKILYTPLLHCEIEAIKRGLGLDGIRVQDLDAEICSKHCKDPIKPYKEWRDEKNPIVKSAIADFIFKNSFPKRIDTEKEEEAFRILQGLILDTSSTDSDITILHSED